MFEIGILGWDALSVEGFFRFDEETSPYEINLCSLTFLL